MRQFFYLILPQEDGLTAQEALFRRGYSKRLVIRLKQTEDGLVRNGVRIRSTTVLRAGETLAVTLPDTGKKKTHLPLPVPVLYEDDDLFVCDKPAGIACHRSGGHQTDTLEQVFSDRTLRAVYRLDKDTSGLLVLAKHTLCAAKLHRQIEKTYLAVCSGHFAEKSGAIELPLLREIPYEPRQIVDPAGLPARTLYRVVWEGEASSAVLCRLMTGRMHQIRAHFAACGHPLLGDVLYGGDCSRIQRQALHCCSVGFCHPFTGERLSLCAPLPADLAAICPQQVEKEF